jgi:hypothetical protein
VYSSTPLPTRKLFPPLRLRLFPPVPLRAHAIFDLDGTLLDSVDLHAIAWQEDNTADRMAAVSGRCGEVFPWREN